MGPLLTGARSPIPTEGSQGRGPCLTSFLLLDKAPAGKQRRAGERGREEGARVRSPPVIYFSNQAHFPLLPIINGVINNAIRLLIHPGFSADEVRLLAHALPGAPSLSTVALETSPSTRELLGTLQTQATAPDLVSLPGELASSPVAPLRKP